MNAYSFVSVKSLFIFVDSRDLCYICDHLFYPTTFKHFDWSLNYENLDFIFSSKSLKLMYLTSTLSAVKTVQASKESLLHLH